MGFKIVASGTSSYYIKTLLKKENFSVVGGYFQGLTKGKGMFICMQFQRKKNI